MTAVRGGIAGVASIVVDTTVSSVPPAIGRWSCRGSLTLPLRVRRARCRGPLEELGDGRPEADRVARAAPDELRVGQRREHPGGCRRIAREDGVGDSDLHHGVRVGDGHARQAVLGCELRRALVTGADKPGVVDLDPVDEGR